MGKKGDWGKGGSGGGGWKSNGASGGGGGGWQKKSWSSGGGGGGWKKGYKNDNGKVNPKLTVWVGDIPNGVTFKELKELGDQCGGCKWAEIYKWKGKNTGAIGFASE